ncbi:FAD-dependent oxidoreductase [Candidatus Sumerlaeota bacterium]|nr:FAD-dependent oxidoreductase [Candidatus Sumerlaeota bacterium]
MGQRVLIVGGVAGGASCAARARRISEDAEIVVFERGPYASFANCGLPYHVGGVIAERRRLLVTKPELLRDRFRIDLRTRHEVTRINRAERTVEVRDLESGSVITERYDALVLSPGAAPLRPPLPGIDSEGIFSVRNIPDVDAINGWIETRTAKSAVVVGGGFIGLEMAENLVHRGLSVTLVEMLDQVMPPLDPEMVSEVHTHLRERGVNLCLRDGVARFEPSGGAAPTVVTQSGVRHESDLVILAIGVKPEIGLAREAGLEIGDLGGIRIDEQMRTSDPSIFAVGDAVEVRDVVTGDWTLLPLAGPANRQGRIAADVIFGREARFRGVQGTAVVGVFDLTIASTGASEKRLRRAGIPHEKVYLFPPDHVGYYPGRHLMHLKVLFDPGSGRVLGAQCVGRAGVDKRIDVIAMAIQMGATVFDLEEAELCYAPQFGAAKDGVNMAGFIAANHIRGDSPLMHWGDVDNGSFLLDVRSEREVKRSPVPNAVNIPIDDLRERIGEMPRDREIQALCDTGFRSYLAVRILKQAGFRARNVSGGIQSKERLPVG